MHDEPSGIKALATAHTLYQQGKLDLKLRLRLIYFIVLTLAFGGITIYDVIVRDVNWLPLLIGWAVSFVLGRRLLTQVVPISWNKKKRLMVAGSIDAMGIILLTAHIVLRYVAYWYLEHTYSNITLLSALMVATLFGVFLGRLMGMLATMHEIHTEHA